jgi:hypothetical protein
MQPVDEKGEQNLNALERFLARLSSGEGYTTLHCRQGRCAENKPRLELFKQYAMEHGHYNGTWNLYGRCPTCGITEVVVPTPNTIPTLGFDYRTKSQNG